MRYKAQGTWPSALFCVKHEQGKAFTILKNFQRNASIYKRVHLFTVTKIVRVYFIRVRS